MPTNWLMVLLAVAAWCLAKRRYVAAQWVLVSAFALAVLLFVSPLGPTMVRTLEHAVPRQQLPETIDGMIVLGGTIDGALSAAYGQPQLGDDAERVTEMVALARQHPRAKIVYAGGGDPARETDALRLFLSGQGVNTSKVLFEDRSRNTHENAIYGKALGQPQPGETWILITSAFHMPRAYGTFLKAGWHVIPYPVSYHVLPAFAWHERGHQHAETAIREWIGILAYKLTGRL